METQIYTLGKPRVPPWVSKHVKDVMYDSSGKIQSAEVDTVNGVKFVFTGDVLMKLDNEDKPVLIEQRNAIRYGVQR